MAASWWCGESFATDGFGDVLFRRFDSTGAPIDASDVTALTNTTGYQQDPTVVGLPDGGFMIGWNEGNTAVSGLSSSTAGMARVFDANGLAVTDAIRISATGRRLRPAVRRRGHCGCRGLG